MNQARIITEKIIDKLYKPVKHKLDKKPRTYRKKARKNYLLVAKQRRPKKKVRSKGIKKQLQYIKRNLTYIEELLFQGATLLTLSHTEYKNLLVVSEIYRQQLSMYKKNANRIEDRIVSINQPHIRPIVRGKAGSSVEFGAKITASYIDEYIFLDHLSWNNFNESNYFIEQVEAYYHQTGYYPTSVHVDKIYRTRSNRAYCKEKGIRISGTPLGRPPKNVSQSAKKQAIEDERIRNCIEGKFGQGKRRFSLNRIMTKLEVTSRTSIAIIFLVMNLSQLLKEVLIAFLCQFFPTILFSRSVIMIHYNLID